PGRARCPASRGGVMFIDLTEEQKRLRAELREYFENCLTEEQRAAIQEDPFGPAYMEHCRRLGRDGMLGVALPKEYGGRGYGPVEQTIFANEIARAEVTYPLITLNSVAPTILQYGTDAQKEFFIPRILAGECHFAIGYSEPGAGTDLDRKSTRLNSSHVKISYAVICSKKKKQQNLRIT